MLDGWIVYCLGATRRWLAVQTVNSNMDIQLREIIIKLVSTYHLFIIQPSVGHYRKEIFPVCSWSEVSKAEDFN